MMSEGDAIIERMYECMDLFSEATNAWFKHAFNAPTEAQRLAWPAIRSGENVLVVAPTGFRQDIVRLPFRNRPSDDEGGR